jgi:S-formylglutathione hydrolase FrmB
MLWYRAIVPKIALGERLPVLSLLHGANSGPLEMTERSQIVKLATGERLIVVIPDAGYSYYSNAKHRRHAQWEDAIMLNLPRDLKRDSLSSRAVSVLELREFRWEAMARSSWP